MLDLLSDLGPDGLREVGIQGRTGIVKAVVRLEPLANGRVVLVKKALSQHRNEDLTAQVRLPYRPRHRVHAGFGPVNPDHDSRHDNSVAHDHDAL